MKFHLCIERGEALGGRGISTVMHLQGSESNLRYCLSLSTLFDACIIIYFMPGYQPLSFRGFFNLHLACWNFIGMRCDSSFAWVVGFQTEVLIVAWQALYLLSLLPSSYIGV